MGRRETFFSVGTTGTTCAAGVVGLLSGMCMGSFPGSCVHGFLLDLVELDFLGSRREAAAFRFSRADLLDSLLPDLLAQSSNSTKFSNVLAHRFVQDLGQCDAVALDQRELPELEATQLGQRDAGGRCHVAQ